MSKISDKCVTFQVFYLFVLAVFTLMQFLILVQSQHVVKLFLGKRKLLLLLSILITW